MYERWRQPRPTATARNGPGAGQARNAPRWLPLRRPRGLRAFQPAAGLTPTAIRNDRSCMSPVRTLPTSPFRPEQPIQRPGRRPSAPSGGRFATSPQAQPLDVRGMIKRVPSALRRPPGERAPPSVARVDQCREGLDAALREATTSQSSGPFVSRPYTRAICPNRRLYHTPVVASASAWVASIDSRGAPRVYSHGDFCGRRDDSTGRVPCDLCFTSRQPSGWGRRAPP